MKIITLKISATCNDPPFIPNGITSKSDDGMSVSVSCNKGFTLVGKKEVNCTCDGDLGTEEPACEPGENMLIQLNINTNITFSM